MKGIELARKYYETYGKEMIHAIAPEAENLIAVGLVGSGSECYGYDDEISADHDYEPGFCLFLPEEDLVDRKVAFALERGYAKLPKEFEGYTKSMVNPVGGARHGVLRAAEFYTEKIGMLPDRLELLDWLHIPDYALCEVTNGVLFTGEETDFGKGRAILKQMPEDVRKKKLAGNLLLMAQSGQYNYNRCIKHGETGGAQLAAIEFVKSAMAVIFLLNHRPMPYYKWSFRAFGELTILSEIKDSLEFLISSENDPSLSETKYLMMEDIASAVIDVLQTQELTDAICGDLEKHAYSVNGKIEDSSVRNLHVLYAV